MGQHTLEAPTAVDMRRFCASEHDIRHYLRAPFAHKGYTYATNGHICVRMLAPDQAEAVYQHKVADSAVGLFERATNTNYAPLPAFDPANDCVHCEGKGKVKMQQCEDCSGDGYFDHGRHEYHCKECDGDGWIKGFGDTHDCPSCEGTGKHWRYVRVAEGVGYDARYLEWIKALPGAQFAVGEAAETGVRPLPGRFVFDGGEGLLMPMADRG